MFIAVEMYSKELKMFEETDLKRLIFTVLCKNVTLNCGISQAGEIWVIWWRKLLFWMDPIPSQPGSVQTLFKLSSTSHYLNLGQGLLKWLLLSMEKSSHPGLWYSPCSAGILNIQAGNVCFPPKFCDSVLKKCVVPRDFFVKWKRCKKNGIGVWDGCLFPKCEREWN